MPCKQFYCYICKQEHQCHLGNQHWSSECEQMHTQKHLMQLTNDLNRLKEEMKYLTNIMTSQIMEQHLGKDIKNLTLHYCQMK